MPGENRLSRRIIKESRLRRKRTQKAEKAAAAKRELESIAQQKRTHVKATSNDSYDQVSLSQEPLLANTQTQPGAHSHNPSATSSNLLSPPLSPGSTYSTHTATSAFDRPGRHQSFNSFSAFSPDTSGARRLSVISNNSDIKNPNAPTYKIRRYLEKRGNIGQLKVNIVHF